MVTVMATLTATAMAMVITMNEINSAFLKILYCALSGVKAPDLHHFTPEQWDGLIKLSREHKVLPLIYDVIYPQIPIPQLRGNVRHQVMSQTLKTDAFLQLYRSWNTAGVEPIVVKGIVCRSLYPKPDLRPSSDEDVLVCPQQLTQAMIVLEQEGLTTSETDLSAYEFPYTGTRSPLYIELHQSLFSSQSDSYGHWNTLFSEVFDTDYHVTYQNVHIRTLPPTQHLLYLILHALKHFAHSGFGIRQVCDMVLFANHYGKEIDWIYLLDACTRIRAERFAAAIFEIGQRYLTFDKERSCYPAQWSEIAVDPEALLEDLLCSGIYGSATTSRVHSSNITLDAMRPDRGEGRKPSILPSVFPTANQIAGRYPYLKKYPWLLPVAWIHRIFNYGKEIKSNGTGTVLESVQIGNKRVELLRQYGVIK